MHFKFIVIRRPSKICSVRVIWHLKIQSVGRSVVNFVGFLINPNNNNKYISYLCYIFPNCQNGLKPSQFQKGSNNIDFSISRVHFFYLKMRNVRGQSPFFRSPNPKSRLFSDSSDSGFLSGGWVGRATRTEYIIDGRLISISNYSETIKHYEHTHIKTKLLLPFSL